MFSDIPFSGKTRAGSMEVYCRRTRLNMSSGMQLTHERNKNGKKVTSISTQPASQEMLKKSPKHQAEGRGDKKEEARPMRMS